MPGTALARGGRAPRPLGEDRAAHGWWNWDARERWSGPREARRGGGARGLARQPQFRVDVREVAFHGARAEDESVRDSLVAHPGRHQREDFQLALAEFREVGVRRRRSLL